MALAVEVRAFGYSGRDSVQPVAIYAGLRAEFDRLETTHASKTQWARLAEQIISAVMDCQRIVMQKQRASREAQRRGAPGEESQRLRVDADDGIKICDKLLLLYQDAKRK